MRNYTSQTIYIGIDVHKKTYAVTTICEGEVVKRDTLKAEPKTLFSYIHNYFKGAEVHTVYEAGFSGFDLHRSLVTNGIHNIVVHPASIKTSARDRVKTDKRDSLKMAKQLSTGDLKGIYIPSEQREAYRILTRLRDRFMEERKRVGNRLKSLLYCHGLIEADNDMKMCRTFIHQVRRLDVSPELSYAIKMYSQEWLHLEEQVKAILKKLEEQSKADTVIDSIYRSVPGIGALSARILSNELGNMKHFKNEKRLFSYTGLTPSEHSSGEHRYQGHISRQGKSLLRKLLVQVAWRAIKQDKYLAEIFERVSKKAGRKKAIVGVARKLIGCIRACFNTGEWWNPLQIAESCLSGGLVE